MLSTALKKIISVAERADSEAKLQIGLENILKELLNAYGVNYNPAVDISLKRQGYSQVSSERPDSLFGHVVLDYKAPGVLSTTSGIGEAKSKIGNYLETVTGGGPSKNPEECAKWAGILWDGFSIVFCHYGAHEWVWTDTYQTTEASLVTLIQTYRGLARMPLNARLLAKYFGKQSEAAKAVLPVFCEQLRVPAHRTNILFREWRRLFQQVSTYGLSQLPILREWAEKNEIVTEDASQILFAMHTYYSLVVKILTAELLIATQTVFKKSLVEIIVNTPDDEALFEEYKNLENGAFYRKYRINNFLEGDFFSWYTAEKSSELASALREMARTFLEFEPATPKLKPENIKDLLKNFYTNIVDEEIRHDLGEYYTPDWLAGYIVDKVGYSGSPSENIIDPACGSGTFLVECISRLRKKCSELNMEPIDIIHTIFDRVKGIDLNPLAVISARANYILSIADLVFTLGEDVEIPVYLADSINVPVEQEGGILEYTLDTEIGDIKFELPLKLITNQVIGKILLKCEEYIGLKKGVNDFIEGIEGYEDVNRLLDRTTKDKLINFYEIIKGLNEREPPWDTIWCRIVKNNFSPKGFGRVDFIVGNPSWVRWSRLPETYRSRVKKFCYYYGLVSGRGFSGGIESDISTVLTFSAVDNWLKIGGRIGFLITGTVFKSDSAKGFRLGVLPDTSGLRFDSIEDLTRIKPFPDAENEPAILLGSKVISAEECAFEKVPCLIWFPKDKANIDTSLSLAEVLEKVEIRGGIAAPVSVFGSPLFIGDAEVFDEVSYLKGPSVYLPEAHRGIINDLARVYWVKVEKYSPDTNRALVRTLTPEELPQAKIVKPTYGAWIEADVLYPLLRGRDVGRYCAEPCGWYQIIPNKHYRDFEPEGVFAKKYPLTYSYLTGYAEFLAARSTYKRYQKDLPIYSIFCVGEYSFKRFKVVWPEQQDPYKFRAAVISEFGDSLIPNLLIVPDHKLYLIPVSTEDEGHYICGFLNSYPVRDWLGGFLISRQIGTAVFEYMGVPKYNPEIGLHKSVADISKKAHQRRLGLKSKEPLIESEEEELARLVAKIVKTGR